MAGFIYGWAPPQPHLGVRFVARLKVTWRPRTRRATEMQSVHDRPRYRAGPGIPGGLWRGSWRYRVIPRSTDPAEGLTRERLRSLPIPDLTKIAARALGLSEVTDARKRLAAAARRKPKRNYGAATSKEVVAELYNAARAEGTREARQVTADRLGLSPRTIDKYLKKARAAGLVPPYRPGK